MRTDSNPSRKLATLLCLLGVLWSLPASAVLNIEITEGVQGAAPIAVVPFGWDDETRQPPEDIASIIAADLARSGLFSPLPREDLVARPTDASQIKFFNWKSVGADNLVIGRLRSVGGDSYTVQFQLFDVFKERQIVGYSFPVQADRLRQVAHKISDLVYEKITGQPGAFNTLVAYVSAVGQGEERTYELQVADSDGHNPRTVLFSKHPLMSPSWSPDARNIAYVSFENKRSRVFMQELATGERTALSELEGINGSPVWSPDGRYLALTLSHNGNPDIYLLDLRSRRLRALTRNPAIDTEPSFSPDGDSIVFTSDRSGSAQIYEIPVRGGRARRLTFEGNYNASPVVSPDGRLIAMVTNDRGNYRIGVYDRDNRSLRVLTDGRLDESPSFAPNGSMLLFATEGTGRGELGAVSADGRMRQRLSLTEGDVREPVWSPFLSQQ